MAGKREQQKQSRQEALLQAAIELFSQKGFDLTTVEEITQKARVAKGTFYNFFTKKEDVLLYFLDREISQSVDEIGRKMPRATTIAERVDLLMSTYVKHLFPNKEFSAVLIKERVMNLGTGSNKNELVLLRQLAELFTQAQKNGEIRGDIEPGHLAELAFAMYTMYVIYWTNGFIKTKAECIGRIREISAFMLQGFAGKGAP